MPPAANGLAPFGIPRDFWRCPFGLEAKEGRRALCRGLQSRFRAGAWRDQGGPPSSGADKRARKPWSPRPFALLPPLARKPEEAGSVFALLFCRSRLRVRDPFVPSRQHPLDQAQRCRTGGRQREMPHKEHREPNDDAEMRRHQERTRRNAGRDAFGQQDALMRGGAAQIERPDGKKAALGYIITA